MRARRALACTVVLAACASARPAQPIAFGAPERFGPGILSTTGRGDVTIDLTDSAHVILLRVYPLAGVETFFPTVADSAPVAPGTRRIAAPPRRTREISSVPVAGIAGPSEMDRVRCERQVTARLMRQSLTAAAADLASARRMAGLTCNARPEIETGRRGMSSERVDEGYLFLIVSDVPTSPAGLREALNLIAVEPDSMGVALPALAELLVGTRARRWAAYSLAPRR